MPAFVGQDPVCRRTPQRGAVGEDVCRKAGGAPAALRGVCSRASGRCVHSNVASGSVWPTNRTGLTLARATHTPSLSVHSGGTDPSHLHTRRSSRDPSKENQARGLLTAQPHNHLLRRNGQSLRREQRIHCVTQTHESSLL